MNAIELREHMADKSILPAKMSRENLRLMFIKTASTRIDEIDVLMLKTECAMKLSYNSPYWSRRHERTYEDLKETRKVNEYILNTLDPKGQRHAIYQ
jgi:hypothetical protein